VEIDDFAIRLSYEAPFRRSAKASPMEDAPRVLASRRCFDGRVFGVRIDTVRYSDGTEHRVDVVEHGASLAIIARPTPRELVLVRQYRHPANAALWEVPAGTAEPGEDPAVAANRELREETGYRAGRIRPIGSVWTSPGFCSEVMHFFVADDLTAGEPALDDDERIESGVFTPEAAWRLVADGTADAKTLLALFWLQGGEGEFGSELGR
jgi:ADP-ribose pyrophosphatase